MTPDTGPRVILVVPDSTTTMEAELPGYWPGIGPIHRVGIPRDPRPITVDELPAYRRKTLELLAPLAEVRADLVLYGCTTAGFLSGPEQDARLRDQMAELTGAPAVTAAISMVEALRGLGVARAGVVTPYLTASNDGLLRFMAAMGWPAAGLNSFMLDRIESYDQVSHDQILAMAERTVAEHGADGVFVACTQLKTFGLLGRLRATLGLPVSGAVEATVQAGRRALGLAVIPDPEPSR